MSLVIMCRIMLDSGFQASSLLNTRLLKSSAYTLLPFFIAGHWETKSLVCELSTNHNTYLLMQIYIFYFSFENCFSFESKIRSQIKQRQDIILYISDIYHLGMQIPLYFLQIKIIKLFIEAIHWKILIIISSIQGCK